MLNKRQDAILNYIADQQNVAVSGILAHIQNTSPTISKITINRDLKKLLDLQLIVQNGAGRGVVYTVSPAYRLMQPIDVERYFSTETDQRIIQEHFNFEIFPQLKNIFSTEEQKQLEELQNVYQHKITQLPQDALRKEFERLTIELSWKSSKIEGNTYSLLETEQLIRNHKESSGHTKAEAVMILNHKIALDYIRKHPADFKTISRRKIEDIHSLLIANLNISRNVRKMIVRITGTKYTPLDNVFQIEEALDTACQLINTETNPFAKALFTTLLIAYIQPFIDGNKRTSRIMSNAILLAYDCCPLSYRSIDEIEYKKALLLFYEQNNITYFKKLFLQQLAFAVENYFG